MGSLQLVARKSENLATDDQHLDLTGAFIDVVNPAIAHPLLHQPVPRIPERSQEGHTSLTNLSNNPACLGLAMEDSKEFLCLLSSIVAACQTRSLAASRLASMSRISFCTALRE